MRADSIFYASVVIVGFSAGMYVTYGLHATIAVLFVAIPSFIFGVIFGQNPPKKKLKETEEEKPTKSINEYIYTVTKSVAILLLMIPFKAEAQLPYELEFELSRDNAAYYMQAHQFSSIYKDDRLVCLPMTALKEKKVNLYFSRENSLVSVEILYDRPQLKWLMRKLLRELGTEKKYMIREKVRIYSWRSKDTVIILTIQKHFIILEYDNNP